MIAHLRPPPLSESDRGGGAGVQEISPTLLHWQATLQGLSRLLTAGISPQLPALASGPQLQPQIPFLAGPSRNATSKG